jgi:ABC-type multidrug transport system ATPase subunit
MPLIVELRNVSKHFGNTRALDGISIDFEEGEAVAFFGPNGAGKSTLLKIISAQLSPTRGKARVLGFDTLLQPDLVKRNVGFVGHRSFMYNELTVEENLEFYGGFFDVSPEDIERVIATTSLKRWRSVKAGHLSYGLRKRSDIARALLNNPKVLVLDELFSGLDQESKKSLVIHFKEYTGQTLLVSSHSLESTRRLCERAVYLKAGQIEKEVKLK